MIKWIGSTLQGGTLAPLSLFVFSIYYLIEPFISMSHSIAIDGRARLMSSRTLVSVPKATRGRPVSPSPSPTPPPIPAHEYRPASQPSNLELFVCQRVSAELQPLLDGWRDAVRTELLAVRDASADAAEWREAVSSELGNLLHEQQRTASGLASANETLAQAPPIRLHKRIEKQEESILASLARLQELISETRLTFERAEAGQRSDKKVLMKAVHEEKATALASQQRALDDAKAMARDLQARLYASEETARTAQTRADMANELATEAEVLSAQLHAAGDALTAATTRLEEEGAARGALESLAARQAVHCSLLGDALALAERDEASRERQALFQAQRAASELLELSQEAEAKRAAAHAEWLSATREVVPALTQATHVLVGRLEEAARRSEHLEPLEGWRGRALQAEAASRAAVERAMAAEAAAEAARAAQAAVEAAARRLALDARLLGTALHEAEVDGRALRARAAAEGAELLRTAAELRSVGMSMEGTLALLTALAGEVISPMRDFELAVAVSAVREQAAADAAAATAAINAANAANAAKAAAAADSASREVLAASIRGWDLERAALTAAREAAVADAREASTQAKELRAAAAAQALHATQANEHAARSEERVACLQEELAASRQELAASREELAASRQELAAAVDGRNGVIAEGQRAVALEREAARVEREHHASEREHLASERAAERERERERHASEREHHASERAAERAAERATEREQQASERAAHATERAELVAQIGRMRLEATRHAEEVAAAHAREMEHWSTQLAAERDSSRDREALVQRAADEARSALERARLDAQAAQKQLLEAHARALASAHERAAAQAAAFEVELAKQRERNDALLAEAKATASVLHEAAERAAAEASAGAAARLEAAQQAARTAAEHHQTAMRTLAREHAETLRRERQLAAQELSSARERAEDAERRLDLMRHAGQLERELEPRIGPSSPELALPPASLRASAPAADFALDGTPWQAMRRQQEAISAAHAQRLSEMRFSAVGRSGGASGALLRRAALAESNV